MRRGHSRSLFFLLALFLNPMELLLLCLGGSSAETTRSFKEINSDISKHTLPGAALSQPGGMTALNETDNGTGYGQQGSIIKVLLQIVRQLQESEEDTLG